MEPKFNSFTATNPTALTPKQGHISTPPEIKNYKTMVTQEGKQQKRERNPFLALTHCS